VLRTGSAVVMPHFCWSAGVTWIVPSRAAPWPGSSGGGAPGAEQPQARSGIASVSTNARADGIGEIADA
jgi:hypothetical protein